MGVITCSRKPMVAAAAAVQKADVDNFAIAHMVQNPCFNRLQFEMSFTCKSATPSRKQLQAYLAKRFKTEPNKIIVFNIKNSFSGRPLKAQAHVYQSVTDLINSEAKHRLYREGLAEKKSVQVKRSDLKKQKNKVKKLYGKAKTKAQQSMM